MTLNASGPISLGGATAGQSINLELSQSATAQVSLNDANVRSLAGVASGAIVMPTNFYGKSATVTGQATYTTATTGVYTWVRPTGVNVISMALQGPGGQGGDSGDYYVCCCTVIERSGGGGGGAGGLAYINNLTVTTNLFISLSSGSVVIEDTSGNRITSFGGVNGGFADPGSGGYPTSSGWTPVVKVGGGSGGSGQAGPATSSRRPGGGGGANGYNSNTLGPYALGGNGGSAPTAGANPLPGGGGGGGGGGSASSARGGPGGGGIGYLGRGSDGVGGAAGVLSTPGAPGTGGSGGASGASAGASAPGAAGGNYGGGGGGGAGLNVGGAGGLGFIRILWPGTTRSYPTTNTGDL